MLSAYELSGEKYPALVKQAETLADKLSAAWSKVSPRQLKRTPLNPELGCVAGERDPVRRSRRQYQHSDDSDSKLLRNFLKALAKPVTVQYRRSWNG